VLSYITTVEDHVPYFKAVLKKRQTQCGRLKVPGKKRSTHSFDASANAAYENAEQNWPFQFQWHQQRD
jgi:hypothetical protein